MDNIMVSQQVLDAHFFPMIADSLMIVVSIKAIRIRGFIVVKCALMMGRLQGDNKHATSIFQMGMHWIDMGMTALDTIYALT